MLHSVSIFTLLGSPYGVNNVKCSYPQVRQIGPVCQAPMGRLESLNALIDTAAWHAVYPIDREESGMEIRLASLLRGAQEAQGTAIIIDVFRAFTTAAVAFDRGAERIVLVAEVEEALELRRRGVGHLCIGEVDGKRPAG